MSVVLCLRIGMRIDLPYVYYHDVGGNTFNKSGSKHKAQISRF